jgi:alkanesulfonate monooxygenase SsuD/methylene tetrahydromethanopterin reductase-like flavin-dependent oxidoreductase (luciferase family)
MDVGVCRAFFVARNVEEKTQAIDSRLAAQRRMTNLAQTPGGKNKSSMMSFADTREASEESALYDTPERIARKLDALRGLGIERILLNGPSGSREHLRRFARDVMPAFRDRPRELTATRAAAR